MYGGRAWNMHKPYLISGEAPGWAYGGNARGCSAIKDSFRPRTLSSSQDTHHLKIPIIFIMALEVVPLPLPPSADPTKFTDFGREVKGVNPGGLTTEQFKEIEELLYKVISTSQR